MAQTSNSNPASAPAAGQPSILKVVAGITAVITLGLAIRQVVVYSTEYRAKQKRLTALIATSRIQADGGDFPAAWASLNQALKTDPDNRTVRMAREDIAQTWLDNSRTGGYIPTLTALSDTLSPALTEGLLQADSIRKADILAHLGWADFLRWREGQRSLNPPARYRQSLALDGSNPYAHVMLAHWMVWQEESLDSARTHFDAALASGRAHDYVRGMQIAALSNRRTDKVTIELLRVANEMRTRGEPVGEGRDSFWSGYNDLLGYSSRESPPPELTAAISAGDLLATYQWAFQGSGYPDAQKVQYKANLAQLQELSGDSQSAAKGYRELLAERDLSFTLRSRLTRAMTRLKGH